MENQNENVSIENQEVTYYSPIELKDSEDFYNQVDENQQTFNSFFKKNKTVNLIIIISFLAVIIAVIFLLRNSGAFIPVMAVLVVAYFVVLNIFSKKVKAKMNDEASKTIAKYISLLDSYVTQNKAFSDIKFNSNEKIDGDLFVSLKIVKDIFHVGGRDVLKGKIFDMPFIGGVCLVKTREAKEDGSTQDYIVFLGKLFVIDASLNMDEGRAVIYLKGKGANGPTDVDDLKKVEGLLSDKYEVYSSCDLNALFTEEVKNALEAFSINDDLIDMFITVEKNRLAVGLSYADGIMTIPLFDPAKRECIEQYKADMEKVVAFVSAIK